MADPMPGTSRLKRIGKWRKKEHGCPDTVWWREVIKYMPKPLQPGRKTYPWVKRATTETPTADPVVLLVDWNDRESGGRKDHGCSQFGRNWRIGKYIQEAVCNQEEDLILCEASWGTIETPMADPLFYY
jgi:hypothetical protein